MEKSIDDLEGKVFNILNLVLVEQLSSDPRASTLALHFALTLPVWLSSGFFTCDTETLGPKSSALGVTSQPPDSLHLTSWTSETGLCYFSLSEVIIDECDSGIFCVSSGIS